MPINSVYWKCPSCQNVLGKCTFRDRSVIDYVTATAECFDKVTDFAVIETDSLFSDGHNALHWCINSQIKHFGKNEPHQSCTGNGQKPSWTKALPSKNDKADKSPPVKMTRRSKALPWKWQGGQKPSRKNDWADRSPPFSAPLLSGRAFVLHSKN
jgi:hypothetical protein